MDTEVMNSTVVKLAGSERQPIGEIVREAPGASIAQVTVILRRAAPMPALPTRFLPEYGSSAADVVAVVASVAAAGLKIVGVHTPSRRIRVEGTVADLCRYFHTAVHEVKHADGSIQQRMRAGGLSIPAELAGIVVAVLGLDDRSQAETRHIVADPNAVGVSYTPVQLAEIYQMPPADGTGQTIAIIELGGGFSQTDLTSYFGGLSLAPPTVTAQTVDGGVNAPGQDPNADGEVLLDIEVAGAIAPKANIVVYFTQNTDAGFVDAISTAAHADPTPCAISVSWGQSEDHWTAQSRTAMDNAIADAVALGATVTVAAGDNGSSDSQKPGAHCDFPASSPHALGCGGTSLHASEGKVVSETVWNDGKSGGSTGGGVSDAFQLPAWQAGAGVPKRSGGGSAGRGVPDVAANADPQTGYQVLVDGQPQVIGGTSAVAPLWAGLIARLAQLNGKPLGLLQPTLYAGVKPGVPVTYLRDITSGNNGAYKARPGWDACTGLGVPQAAVSAL